ncbi:hypothetical protein GQ457_17G010870 [Hibiscus cannabinus]
MFLMFFMNIKNKAQKPPRTTTGHQQPATAPSLRPPSHHAPATAHAYQKEGRKRVKVKDLKPKRIKGYLEYKFSQKSPALLKYLLFNDF